MCPSCSAAGTDTYSIVVLLKTKKARKSVKTQMSVLVFSKLLVVGQPSYVAGISVTSPSAFFRTTPWSVFSCSFLTTLWENTFSRKSEKGNMNVIVHKRNLHTQTKKTACKEISLFYIHIFVT